VIRPRTAAATTSSAVFFTPVRRLHQVRADTDTILPMKRNLLVTISNTWLTCRHITSISGKIPPQNRSYYHTSSKSMSSVTTVSSSTEKPSFEWCRTSSIGVNGGVDIEIIAGSNNKSQDKAFREINNKLFDLTKSADWMEYIEHDEDRLEDQGGAGAYDTLRCDILIPSTPRIWGEKYHLDRLKKSYGSLLDSKEEALAEASILEVAMKESRAIMHRLLDEAALAAKNIPLDNTSSRETSIILIRLTLLWSPPKSDDSKQIVVRGHACSTCKPIEIHSSPKAIVVSIAAHESSKKDGDATLDKSLPTRFADPENKIASWCRVRRQMESSSTYKPPGVDEVLMVRSRKDLEGNDRLEILEGISSNVFVIYNDNTLRTATEGVLNGFVRHLVLESASECGIKIDSRPVFLHEADQWKEVFITSSSRLIYPISKVLIPNDDKESNAEGERGEMKVVFRDTVLEGNQNSASFTMKETPGWQKLLNVILQKGGYSEI
jgi:hypothetical protein